VISTTVAGTNGTEDLGWVESDAGGILTQTFTGLPEAQAAAGIPLYVPAPLPAGARLQRVEVMAYSGQGADVRQYYQLTGPVAAGHGWLLFTQREAHGVTGPNRDRVGWGVAHDDPTARPIPVAGGPGTGGGAAPGYLVERDGWRVLDWKPDDDRGFELAGPAERFTVEDLLAQAATVAPSR
jgi:hypothetical protein